jgi:iron complex outermembrane receptor protein
MRATITPITAAIQLVLLSLPAQVYAQASPGAAPPAAAASTPAPAASSPAAAAPTSAQLDVVTVTAQKRLQKGQDVPISMTVLSPATIESRGVGDALQLTQVAPTLQVGDSNSYSLRGIGTLNTAGNNTLEGAVAVAIDGVNMSRPQMGNMQFADIERIEVLNGPQGMLFGKNATAGLINVTTTRPRLGVTEGRVRVDAQHRTSGAETNGFVEQFTLNTPVTADSALRVNVFGTQQGELVSLVGPAQDSHLGEKQSGIKAKYLWNITPDLNIYLIGDYTDRTGAGGTPLSRTRREFGPGSVVAGYLAPSGVVASPTNTVIAADGTDDYRFRSKGLQAEVNYELGGGWSLTDILSHRSFREFAVQDGDGVARDFLSTIQTDFTFTQTSNELRLLTPSDGDFEGQAGLFIFRSHTNGTTFMHGQFGLPGPVIPGSVYNIGGLGVNDLQANSEAVFGQGTYKLTKDWQLLLGMRYTREHDSFHLTQDATQFGLIPLISPTLDITQPATSNDFTYKLGTQYDLARDVMAYATFAHGAKGPGFNAGLNGLSMLPLLVVKPEKVNAIELGVKSTLLNRRLLINASVFNQAYTNLQAQTFNQPSQAFITQNAGKSRSRGADLEIQARPDQHWTLTASGVWLDAKFTDFPDAQCYTGQSPQNVANGTCSATGTRLPNSPKLTATATAEYQHAIGKAMKASYGLNAYYRSGVNFGIGGDPGMAVGAVTLIGANVTLSDAASAWRVSLYCRNCTDKRVVMSISPDALDAAQAGVASYLQQFGYNSFRTVGLSADYRF